MQDPRTSQIAVNVIIQSTAELKAMTERTQELHDTRMTYIEFLRQDGWSVPEIAEATGMKIHRIRELIKDGR